jgi:hypothetical protein
MTKHKQKIYKKKSAIEAKISEGKRTCGLNKSYYRGFDGDNMWAGLSIMALNIRKILRDMVPKPDLILRFA